jgi:hypothetical protein
MLTDVEHVEAVALIRSLAERLLADFPRNPTFEAAVQWCDDHRPSPDAYLAAMSSLVSVGAEGQDREQA